MIPRFLLIQLSMYKVRMITDFPQNINSVQHLSFPCENRLHLITPDELFVGFPLDEREFTKEDLFGFSRKISRDVGFHSTEEVRVNQVAEDNSAFIRGLDLNVCCVGVTADIDWYRELSLENGQSTQSTREDKVE